MAYKLWISPITGHRRIGTRLSDVRSLFDRGITTGAIFELLKSCPVHASAREIKKLLAKRGFDVAGVMESKDGIVIGYVQRSDLETGSVRDHIKMFEPDLLIADSAPIPELFDLLNNKEFLFVLNKTRIEGIVTRADLNKPPVRIYLFFLISLLEMHLGFWIRKNYKNEFWKDYLSEDRLKNAQKLYENRKKRNQEIGIFECLQFADKRDLFLKNEDLRKEFSISSRRNGEEILKQVEILRDSLAHSQDEIALGLGWEILFETVKWMEKFLGQSDNTIQKQADVKSTNYNEELW